MRRTSQRFTTIRIPTQIYDELRAKADAQGVPIYALIEPLVSAGALSGRVTRKHRGHANPRRKTKNRKHRR